MDTALLRKEIFGMQLDNLYLLGLRGMMFIKEEMTKHFQSSMILIDEKNDFNHHGWFILKYRYVDKKYIVSFEGEFNSFNVRIITEDGGFISLKQLKDYENDLLKKNIIDVITILQKVLVKPIEFYKVHNNKLYKQTNGSYKQVKDWKEICR